MATVSDFDHGCTTEPFATLVRETPGPEVYPPEDFRTEWGAIYGRGQLNGSARVLVIGQDPAAQEAITRRIFVGKAGQRVQAFLDRLQVGRSYFMMNAFAYSVYGQQAAEQHAADPGIVAYQHAWFSAVRDTSDIKAVVAFGRIADTAWQRWLTASPDGVNLSYAAVPHPSQPEAAAGGDPVRLAAAHRKMLGDWNDALARLYPAVHSDRTDSPVLFDEGAPPPMASIPPDDLGPGRPKWWLSGTWAERMGADAEEKRATIMVTVPTDARRWLA